MNSQRTPGSLSTCPHMSFPLQALHRQHHNCTISKKSISCCVLHNIKAPETGQLLKMSHLILPTLYGVHVWKNVLFLTVSHVEWPTLQHNGTWHGLASVDSIITPVWWVNVFITHPYGYWNQGDGLFVPQVP